MTSVGRALTLLALAGVCAVAQISERARRLHEEAFVFDGHVHMVTHTFIPLINVVSPVLWVAFGSWMLALEYLSYPMENHNMKFKRVRQRLSEKRMISFGFGLAAMLGTMIPLVNFIIMPAAVAGAAALWVDHWSVSRA